MTERTRVIAFSLVTLVLCVGLAGAVELKLATLAPDGSTWVESIRKGAEEISRRTEQRVTFRFYPGGSMGAESAVLRKIRIGQLHGGVFTAGTLASADPEFQVYCFPLLFHSYDEVDYVRQRYDAKIVAHLAENGFTAFGVIEGGFAYLMSSKATRGFEDLKNQKAWVPEGDSIGATILSAAGVPAIPLPISDVLTGLQTGLIDTVAGPPVGAVALQWFTKVKYLTDIPIIYTCGAIVISNVGLERVGAEDRAVIAEVLGRVSGELNAATRRDNERAREALVRQGIQVVAPSADNMAHWEQVAADATRRLVEKNTVSPQALADVQRLVQDCRGASGSQATAPK